MPALKALIVDDRDGEVHQLVRGLEDSGYELKWNAVGTTSEMERAIDEHEWDIVFCDDTHPHLDGHEVLNRVRDRDASLPVVFISGKQDSLLDDLVPMPVRRASRGLDQGPAIESPMLAALPAVVLLCLALTGAVALLLWAVPG